MKRAHHWGFLAYAGHLLSIWALALSNAFLGVMILWSVRFARRIARPWAEVAPLLTPLGVYAIFLVVAVAGSYDPVESSADIKELLTLVTLGLGVVLVRGERQVRLLVKAITLMIALLAVYGVLQFHFTAYGGLHRRIVGLFSHYQTFAGVLLVGVLLLTARLFKAPRSPWHWLALVFVVWALILTLTRGAWVALAVTLAVFGLASARRRMLAAGVVTAVLAGVVFTAVAPETWRERVRSIYDLRDSSNYDRLCMIEAGLKMVSERPFFGLGPRMVKARYPIYRNPTAPRFTVPHLHNAFLDIAAERGLLSLAAYFWLIASALRLAWSAYRREGGLRGPRADLHLSVVLALVGFNVAGLFENNWGDTEVQRLVLFLLAVPCCLEERPAEEHLVDRVKTPD